jgi:hypothetical protein
MRVQRIKKYTAADPRSSEELVEAHRQEMHFDQDSREDDRRQRGYKTKSALF